jgi:hypothetical protein
VDKAQLHSDDIKPKEVPKNEILEAEGTTTAPVEMDAGYWVAELATGPTFEVPTDRVIYD